MATWISAWGVDALIDQGHCYSTCRRTAWTLNTLIKARLMEWGRVGDDRELGRYLAEHVFEGQVLRDET